jgi:hypothetical protein
VSATVARATPASKPTAIEELRDSRSHFPPRYHQRCDNGQTIGPTAAWSWLREVIPSFGNIRLRW